GHSSGSMALFATLSYIVWHITRRRATTAAAAVVGLASAGLVGYSRVALRHHHTGDVFAGYALAVGWLILLLRSFRRTQERRPG
ncbi:MAG: phosphatase PAP2 family protein, partial [Chloroflexi bacterium]|nr:phosphatase PAP2 family protein [Chloroflexota bacterium]